MRSFHSVRFFSSAACLLTLMLLFFFGLTMIGSSGTPDMYFHWLKWIYTTQQQGPFAGYASIVGDNYPPLSAVLLWAGDQALKNWGFHGSIVVKLTLTGFLLLSSIIYCYWSRDLRLTTIFLAGNFIAVVGLAYLDILVAPFILAACFCLYRQKFTWFLLFYSMAIFIKWQPLIMAPFVMVACWQHIHVHHYRWRKITAVLLPPVLIVGAMVWLFGYKELITSLRLALNTNDFSSNAMNINGLVNEIIDIHAWRAAMDSLQHNGDEQAAITAYTEANKILYVSSGGLSTLRYVLSKLFFWGCFFYLLWRYMQSPTNAKRLLFYSTAAYVFYFIFNTGVHENHLHMALLLASALVVIDRHFFYF